MKRVFCFILLSAKLAWCWNPENPAEYYKQFLGTYQLIEEDHTFQLTIVDGKLTAYVLDLCMDFELIPTDLGKFDVNGYPNTHVDFFWTEDGKIGEAALTAPIFNGNTYRALPVLATS